MTTPEQVAAVLLVMPPAGLAAVGVLVLTGAVALWSASLDIARLLVRAHGRHRASTERRDG